MYRRRRPTREIAFSFDSFLDMVANVVGVIIRLILVVWVGARSYTGLVTPPPEEPPAAETSADDGSDVVALPTEPPLEEQLRPHQQELARLQQQLLDQLRDLQQTRDQSTSTDQDLAVLAVRKVE